MAGIPDPLRQFPTLFALLDAVEIMVLDSMEKEEERQRYFIRAYTPPPGWAEATGELPPGWSPEEEMEGFRSLMSE